MFRILAFITFSKSFAATLLMWFFGCIDAYYARHKCGLLYFTATTILAIKNAGYSMSNFSLKYNTSYFTVAADSNETNCPLALFFLQEKTRPANNTEARTK